MDAKNLSGHHPTDETVLAPHELVLYTHQTEYNSTGRCTYMALKAKWPIFANQALAAGTSWCHRLNFTVPC
jgi:hypothetical protein